MDTETFNMIGSFRSRAAALRAVAETVHQYGEHSDEALTLVLFRQDGSPDQAYVAQGEALVRLALAAAAPAHRGNGTARGVAAERGAA
jgi:hypothetical protein